MKKIYKLENEQELLKALAPVRDEEDIFPYAGNLQLCVNLKTDKVWLEDCDGDTTEFITDNISAKSFIIEYFLQHRNPLSIRGDVQ